MRLKAIIISLLCLMFYRTALAIPQKATPAQAKKLTAGVKGVIPLLKDHKADLKALLSSDLAKEYSLCYWGNDGCYWCSDDGVNWFVVYCITKAADGKTCCYGPCNCNAGGLQCCSGTSCHADGSCN